MKAMILAAGLGTRMRPLTDNLPKPLLPVGDSTLIELQLQNLAQAGIKDLVINISYLAEKIEAHLGNGEAYGLHIEYSREETPLETAGGIKQALALLGSEPFLVINGDVWTDYPLVNLLKKAEHFDKLAHVVLVSNPEHHPAGDFSLAPDASVKVEGEPKFTFSGISLLSPELFTKDLRSNRLADLLVEHMERGEVSGEVYQGLWMDIGTPERLQELDDILMKSR